MNPIDSYRARLLESYIATVNELEQIRWRSKTGGLEREGEGEMRRVAAHLCAVEERIVIPCTERILNGEPSTQAGTAAGAWDDAPSGDDEPLDSLISKYKDLRCRQAERLRHVPAQGWNRKSRHPRLGQRTLQWWIEQSLAHSRGHLRKLSKGKGDEQLFDDPD